MWDPAGQDGSKSIAAVGHKGDCIAKHPNFIHMTAAIPLGKGVSPFVQ